MKKYFLTGLATLLPVAITIYVIHFMIDFLTRPFVGIVTKLLSRLPISPMGFLTSLPMVKVIARCLILLTLFLLTLLVGMVARWFLVDKLAKLGDYLLQRIPLVNKVYKTMRDIIRTLFSSNQNSFKQVVMIPFPSKESYCLGLVTREAPHNGSPGDRISVFIPTTPNPTTGFMVITERSELIYLDMKSEDAVKYVLSCGVIKPGMEET
ncbi:MAG: DUF502 domain-containing protein [Verrucomicrobiota bacterium]|nr:DUF502 domain-containing protein [Verrucomicrobiota bacterium]